MTFIFIDVEEVGHFNFGLSLSNDQKNYIVMLILIDWLTPFFFLITSIELWLHCDFY